MEPAGLPPGYRRQAFDAIGSTNSHALAVAREGAPGGLWVTARRQESGRGRRNRAWDSPEGNLYASLLLRDPAPPALAATISFVAGIALDTAICDLAGPTAVERLVLKWPNDLLCDGRKIAGILVEGEELAAGGMAVVVGIGVNCTAHPQAGTVHPASDLRRRGFPIDPEALFGRLAIRLAEAIGAWDRGRGFAAIRQAWLGRALGFGGAIRVNLPDRVIEGRFDALDAAGRLIVGLADGRTETVSAGDVFFGRGAS